MLSGVRGILLIAFLSFVVSGCLHRGPAPAKVAEDVTAGVIEPVPPANLGEHVRDNCASLLYDLLNDEKDLSKLLIIKRESRELNQLVKDISAVARADAAKLEELAAADRTLHLDAMGLPSGEAATRKAIAKTKGRELLGGKGADFEFKLLLTQVESLNYAIHLAHVAAENESRPEHAREFLAMAERFRGLYGRTIDLLRATARSMGGN